MPNSMTDILVGLARRMPRVVREHEVLRVAGWMPGNDPEAISKTAVGEVLKWAQKRSGGRLPPEAWQHTSFEYLSGGRNSSCVRLISVDSDIWAIRLMTLIKVSLNGSGRQKWSSGAFPMSLPNSAPGCWSAHLKPIVKPGSSPVPLRRRS